MSAVNFVSQASSLNSLLILSCPIPGVLPVPVPLTGFGVSDMLTIDDSEPTNVDVGLDGGLIVYTRPVVVTGRMTFAPNNPATKTIINIQKRNQTGYIIPLVLTVTDYNGFWEYNYSNFFITSAFKGYELRERVQDWTASFKASLPNTSIIGDIIGVATGAASLLGGL